MTSYLVGAVVLASFVGLSIWQWREQDREHPIELWKQRYPGPEAIFIELGAALGLARERQRGDLRWLGKVFLTPVWFFWGALRAQRPEQQLLRWRLVGARDGRAATVFLDAEGATLGVAGAMPALWVTPDAPLDQQEGLRALHPVGSERWWKSTRIIQALFALGAGSLRTDDVALHARVVLDALAPSSRRALVAKLMDLVRVLEER